MFAYYIEIKLKSRDEAGTLALLKEFLEATHFPTGNYTAAGFPAKTAADLLVMTLTEPERTPSEVKKSDNENEETVLKSSFEGRGSTEFFFPKLFEYIAPSLEDGSEIYIEPDYDFDRGTVKNGKVSWECGTYDNETSEKN